MKKRMILSILTLTAILLCACQPTPKQEVVINKGDGVLEEVLQEEKTAFSFPSYRETVPAKWSKEIETDQNLTIIADAQIDVPDIDKISVPEVQIAALDGALIEKFLPYIQENCYDGRQNFAGL